VKWFDEIDRLYAVLVFVLLAATVGLYPRDRCARRKPHRRRLHPSRYRMTSWSSYVASRRGGLAEGSPLDIISSMIGPSFSS
jgi:hypothetical protein